MVSVRTELGTRPIQSGWLEQVHAGPCRTILLSREGHPFAVGRCRGTWPGQQGLTGCWPHQFPQLDALAQGCISVLSKKQ